MLLVPGMSTAERDRMLPEILQRHQQVSFRMHTHVSLTCSNMPAGVWLSAKMLSKGPERARLGARELSEHLKRLRLHPASCTCYEKHWLRDPVKMEQLQLFETVDPPVLLWRLEGAFKDMFIFLADRFLGAPDSVLDAERVHAKWKCIESIRRSIAFPNLNAILKLSDYIFCHGGLPSSEELHPHVVAFKSLVHQRYRATYMAAAFQSVSVGH